VLRLEGQLRLELRFENHEPRIKTNSVQAWTPEWRWGANDNSSQISITIL
jgi:hypothetical protein